jgi:hypothetical protein
VLSEHGVKIAPCTYYEARNRRPSQRLLRRAKPPHLSHAHNRPPQRMGEAVQPAYRATRGGCRSAVAAKPAHGALEVREKGEVAVAGRQGIRCLRNVVDEPVSVGEWHE